MYLIGNSIITIYICFTLSREILWRLLFSFNMLISNMGPYYKVHFMIFS